MPQITKKGAFCLACRTAANALARAMKGLDVRSQPRDIADYVACLTSITQTMEKRGEYDLFELCCRGEKVLAQGAELYQTEELIGLVKEFNGLAKSILTARTEEALLLVIARLEVRHHL